MKKNDIINEWLAKHGDPEVRKQVERELKLKEKFDDAMEFYLVFGEFPDWYKK